MGLKGCSHLQGTLKAASREAPAVFICFWRGTIYLMSMQWSLSRRWSNFEVQTCSSPVGHSVLLAPLQNPMEGLACFSPGQAAPHLFEGQYETCH